MLIIPEHCRRVQTMVQQEVSNFLGQQSTLSQTDEPGRAFCTPTLPSKNNKKCHVKYEKLKMRVKFLNHQHSSMIIVARLNYTLGFVMCGGQYGYMIVSKFGLHQIATHSPICICSTNKLITKSNT